MMPAVPMARVIAWELEILGSHGMQAFRYDDMLQMILSGKLKPEKLVQKTVTLEEGARELVALDSFRNDGITVINQF
jgi:alcohol dehydrogenase